MTRMSGNRFALRWKMLGALIGGILCTGVSLAQPKPVLYSEATEKGNEPPITILGDLQNQIASANLLGSFTVEGDTDPYDGIPHELYWICLQSRAEFDVQPACDRISFTEGFSIARYIIPFEEALDPLRGQEILLWVQALNVQTNQVEVSYAYSMRAALSNIALRPPGSVGNQSPFNQVYPADSVVFESVDDFAFRWPRTTTGLAGVFGGFNSGADKHVMSLQLQQSSAVCERTKFACPGIGNACLSTDPLDCSLDQRGYCTFTEACSIPSDVVSFPIDLNGLTSSFQDVGTGQARTEQLDGHEFIEFRPDQSVYQPLLDQVNADRVFFRVATCTDVNGAETCGRSENVSHLGVGTIGIPNDGGGDPGGGGLPSVGIAFADSPLVDAFRHPACISCHVLERDALAGVGIGPLHVGFVGSVEEFHNPNACVGCHSADKAPQILGTSYSATHDLDLNFPGEDYESWWAWFAPEYEGGLTWPDHLEDPESPDYDPSTACALFVSETPDPDVFKHHMFEDPRIIWSIVGGEKPANNFIDELAPPGTDLNRNSSLQERLDALSIWEDWVNEWVDGGMNCGTTFTTNSAGGPNEDVNTTPPTTTSNGSTGTYVGGAPGSDTTTITNLDCTPDQDSASERCAWTLFACGSDDVQVQSTAALCTEPTATPYTQAGVNPAGLCDVPVSSCYKFDPGVGGGEFWSFVQVPAEIGDHTRLSYFSIDVEGNQEVVRTETYDFVDADVTAPISSAELFYDIDDDEHKVRFSCSDNSENCMIFYKVNDPGEDETPALNNTTQILNSNGNPFDADDNVLGFLKTDRVQRIRWIAQDAAQPLNQRNVEFDQQCFEDNLALCPGKLTLQNQCLDSCEAGIRSDCELSCGAGSGNGVETDCVAACVASSPVDCLPGCRQTCDRTNTLCPGGTPMPGQETGCVRRTTSGGQGVQCYHELVYDPAAAFDTTAPEVATTPTVAPRSDGTYPSGFRVSLQCTDSVNDCEIYYTTDGREPTADPRDRYRESIIIPEPEEGRTATTTLKFFSQDNAVPPNASPIQSMLATVALPHTDDDLDGFTEDQGDCNDDNNLIFPGAVEMCDLIDNDCNGIVDDVISGPSCAPGLIFSNGFEPLSP